jgi:4-amino-4-deoxy-L-arabinose transferase-like glycosyltransferase
MTSQAITSAAPTGRASVRRAVSYVPWQRLPLFGVLLLAALLNLFRLSEQGYGNIYYTAAVKSMLTGWHAFFFASFDAGGFVSVDKPPLGLWVQAASAKLLGVSGFSVILPQVIAGVLSVALLYHLVRRTWGEVAGLLSALALALTPISVVANRTNNLDSLLVLVVLLAAWAVIRATETGRLGWLILGFVLVGLGFNIKMLQAYLVLPALCALYVLAARTGWRRIVHLLAAGAFLAVVSLSWAVAVDLTPADARPYVGSSGTNSAINLILGYNGLDRLFGRGGPGDGARRADGVAQVPMPPAGQVDAGQGVTPPDLPANVVRPGGGGPGGAGETGAKGPLRLLSRQLGGQIGWLLPLAVLGLAGAVSLVRLGRSGHGTQDGQAPSGSRWRVARVAQWPADRRVQSLILWGAWFLTCAVFFSIAGFFHRYYLVMLAPAVAALCGIGAVALWRLYRRPGLGGWLLPVAVLATAAVQAHILADYPAWNGRLTPVVLGLAGVLALMLIVARLRPSLRMLRSPVPALVLGVTALLAAPAVWAGISVWEGTNTTLPAAGPADGGFGMPGGRAGPAAESVRPELLRYLEENRGDATFLVATPNAMSAAPIILATGEPVMAIGGFSGGDQILTAGTVAELVRDGTVRFFLVGGGPGSGGFGFAQRGDAPDGSARFPGDPDFQQRGSPGATPNNQGAGGAVFGGPIGGAGSAISWVTQTCTPVPATAIGGATNGLYDCAGAQG